MTAIGVGCIDLAVDPAWQRHSLGRLLMQRVEAELLVRACPKINLMVRAENTAVLDFYARLGFQCGRLGQPGQAPDPWRLISNP